MFYDTSQEYRKWVMNKLLNSDAKKVSFMKSVNDENSKKMNRTVLENVVETDALSLYLLL